MKTGSKMSAEVLVEALPYIQEYAGKIIVVKYGGNAMINEDLKQAVIEDIVLLNLVGIKVVLVHGGGPEISEMLKKIGKESKFPCLRKQADVPVVWAAWTADSSRRSG